MEKSESPKYPLPVSKLDDKEIQGVPVALYRAARHAHRVAHQHGTGVVVMREGKVVTINPDPEMYGEEQGKR